MGRFYGSYSELLTQQSEHRTAWYAANDLWWNGGYGGKTDEEAMIGDEGGERDGEEGLLFLDRLLHSVANKSKTGGPTRAMDAGRELDVSQNTFC